jgi:hypothetical protein
MRNMRIRKSFIIAVALSGAVINLVYGSALLRSFFDPQYSSAIREILISAIVLEFGWAALLVWTIFQPFERCHVLLFTIIPIFFGNILHSVNQFSAQNAGLSPILLNTLFGFLYSGLYCAAYLAGKSETHNIRQKLTP